MAKSANVPVKEVKKLIAARVARNERNVFSDILVDALISRPSQKDWRRMSKDEPDKYVRSLQGLGKLAGYVDRHESVSLTGDIKDLVPVLIARYGRDKARDMLGDHGLPRDLIPVDGEIVVDTDK